jgi:hypothetical protein
MDQLKGVLVAAKKYHFWVLCGIVVTGAVVVWQTSAASGDRRFADGKQKLKTELDAVKALAGSSEPHNDQTLEELRQRQASLTKEVWTAWNYLYLDQNKANQWPAELGETFRAIIGSLKWGEEIPETQRYEYAMFIKKCLPRLARDLKMRMTRLEWEELEKTIKTGGAEPSVFKKRTAKKKSAEDAEADAAKKAMDQSQREMIGLVDWDDYEKFKDHFTWQALPSGLEIWLAQEDLWVYQALLQIIIETNQGASGHSGAPIKRIMSMDIAQNAATALASSQTGSGMGYGAGMMSGYPAMSGPSGMYGSYPGGGGSGPSGMYGSYPGGSGFSGGPGGYSGGSGPSGGPGGYSGGGGPSGGPGGYSGGSGPSGMSGSFPGGSAPSGTPPPGYPRPGGTGTGVPPPGYPASGAGTGMTSPGSADTGEGPGAMGMGIYAGSIPMAGMTPQQRMHFRYVDAKAQPLPADSPQLKGEFKMMPVRLVLVMDHRLMPRLLANCANSSMPVEVLSVNVFSMGGGGPGGDSQGPGRPYGPTGSPDAMTRGASPYSGGPGGMSGSGPSSGLPGSTGGTGYAGRTGVSPYSSSPGASSFSGPMSSPYSGSPMGASGSGVGRSAQPMAMGPYDVETEIQGIIFIFNPPDQTNLTASSTAEGAPAPAVSVPSEATPAPSPAPPAASTPPAAAAPAPASTPPPSPSGGPAAKASAEPPPPAATPTGGSPPATKTP